MNLGLDGKTAVVTGGSKGIGYAAARGFLLEGADVVICARDKAQVEKAVLELEKECGAFGRILGITADMTREEDAYRTAKTAYEVFGSVDCWVNNVGASFPKNGDEYRTEDIRRITDVCFSSVIYGTQAAFRYMKETGGSIVNISSLAARCPTVGASTLYGPLKAAVVHLAVTFAGEYGAYGVRVNAVLPGFTATPAVAATITPEYLKRNADGTLLRRVARPEEIADAILFLSSERASYITGASLEASGGRSIVLNPEFSYEKKAAIEAAEK